MRQDQQDEALEYFRAHAGEWREKARTLSKVKFNVIQTRNNYVLEVIGERPGTNSVLDVGCGTGDLVCTIAKGGIRATGVDFAKDMIEAAEKNAVDEHLTDAVFQCCSVFDFDFGDKQYDVISANGFIEYISQEEMKAFFDTVIDNLSPGGSFVVGSRNRLFNVFTLNAFTQMEIDASDIEALLLEAIALSTSGSLDRLPDIKPAPLQKPDTQHTITGIGVTTRFQYTPLQLVRLLEERGLKVVEICPIHIHGVPPIFNRFTP